MKIILMFTQFMNRRSILGKLCGIFTIAWFVYNLLQLLPYPFSGRPDYFLVISSLLGFLFLKIETK